MGTTSRAQSVAGEVLERVPSPLHGVIEGAREHHTLTLAGGLAFFGILSIGPAVGVGLALLRLVAPDATIDRVVDTLQGTFTEQFGLADLLGQMQDRAARYAGIGVAVLLWPATTLASGWTRSLDAVMETESQSVVRGLRGRLRGLLPGGVLVAAMLLSFAAVTFGTALAGGDQALVLVAVIAITVVAQFAFVLVIYRWLPTESRPWATLWRGAALATAGVVAATVGLALALQLGEGVADRYPPALSTAIVLGLWLYAANTALLLGAEYNEFRARQG